MASNPRYRADLREKAAELYRSGLSTREVGERMDLSRTRVVQLLDDCGVKRRGPGWPRGKKRGRSQRSQEAA